MALVKNVADNKKPENNTSKKKLKLTGRNSFGVKIGGGLAQEAPSFAGARQTQFIGVTGKNRTAFDAGLFYQAALGGAIDIRPSLQFSVDGGELYYERTPTASPRFDTVTLKNSSFIASLPLIFRLSKKAVVPYIMLGPSFSFIASQDATAQERVPLKKSVVTGDVGFGVDIRMGKAKFTLSPEIKYSRGFTSMQDGAGTPYTITLSSLKKQGFTFNLYFRNL